MTDLPIALRAAAQAVEQELDRLLLQSDTPESRLFEAMRHGVLGGGKRMRPFLVLTTAEMFGVAAGPARRTAAAVEMVHCYSLVHDDLPAMDDDDLRRGRPTVHRAFDEATAILAGDALLTGAFEVLADDATHTDPRVRCALVSALSGAAGARGMVGGQMLDLLAAERELDVPAITRLQRLKTGRLIQVAAAAGAILGRVPASMRQALEHYAHDLGLAFQIVDDLLDVEGNADAVGKAVGKDAEAGKATFVSLMGVERAREQAGLLVDQAIAHLDHIDRNTDLLEQLARFVLGRET